MSTGRGTLLDVHAHFLTDDYVLAATAAGHSTPDGMPRWPQWSVSEHLTLMDVCGIERSLLSISSPGVHFGDDAQARELARSTAEFAAAVVAEHPDRFGHLAILPLPDVEGAVEAARYGLDDLGADGVVILSNAGGRYPGDASLDPLFDDLDRRGALVLVHPTSPPHVGSVALGHPAPMVEFLFDSARAAVDLVFADRIRRHPGIRWVFTHGGGVVPLLTDRVDTFGLIGGSELDTAGQLSECWFDCAGTPLPSQLPALADAVGTAHLLYGSDHCFTPLPAVAAQVASLDTPAGTDGTWRDLVVAGGHALTGTTHTPGTTENAREGEP